MPEYDFRCDHCGPMTIYHGMQEDHPSKCPVCGSRDWHRVFEATAGVMDPCDWSHENGGRGRVIPSLQEKVDSPKVYCRSAKDMVEHAKRKGYTVEKG